MTRSRKKTPCCHIVKKDGWYKSHFNRLLRRHPINYDDGVSSIPDGKAYRKAHETWLIDDWKCVGITFGESRFEDRSMYEKWYIRK